MDSNFKYTGKVSIKKKINGRFEEIYSGHNSGTDLLFELLLKLLCQVEVEDESFPKYIDIRASGGATILASKLTITKTVEVSEGNYYAVIESLLYSNNILNTSNSNKCSLILLDAKDRKLASYDDVDTKLFSNLSEGMQLLLTWKLNISN